MDVTRVLSEEHRAVERVLVILETASQRLEEDESVRAGFFVDAADFIRGFVDACHHNKEEIALFPVLEAAGMARESGPLGAALDEHERGRQLTYDLRAAAEKLERGDVPARGTLLWKTESYVKLARRHMKREEEDIFPVVDATIRGEKQARMIEAFELEEQDEAGEGSHERYLGLLEALEREARAM